MLTYDAAQNIIGKAIESGAEQSVMVAAVVVDLSGRVIATGRSPKSGFINIEIAERKAMASANFGAPTMTVLAMVKDDPILLASVLNEKTLSLLPGGMPILIDGKPAGSLGIAGGHYTQDHAIGEAVLSELQEGNSKG